MTNLETIDFSIWILLLLASFRIANVLEEVDEHCIIGPLDL
jgi:hypothetical protein